MQRVPTEAVAAAAAAATPTKGQQRGSGGKGRKKSRAAGETEAAAGASAASASAVPGLAVAPQAPRAHLLRRLSAVVPVVEYKPELQDDLAQSALRLLRAPVVDKGGVELSAAQAKAMVVVAERCTSLLKANSAHIARYTKLEAFSKRLEEEKTKLQQQLDASRTDKAAAPKVRLVLKERSQSSEPIIVSPPVSKQQQQQSQTPEDGRGAVNFIAVSSSTLSVFRYSWENIHAQKNKIHQLLEEALQRSGLLDGAVASSAQLVKHVWPLGATKGGAREWKVMMSESRIVQTVLQRWGQLSEERRGQLQWRQWNSVPPRRGGQSHSHSQEQQQRRSREVVLRGSHVQQEPSSESSTLARDHMAHGRQQQRAAAYSSPEAVREVRHHKARRQSGGGGSTEMTAVKEEREAQRQEQRPRTPVQQVREVATSAPPMAAPAPPPVQCPQTAPWVVPPPPQSYLPPQQVCHGYAAPMVPAAYPPPHYPGGYGPPPPPFYSPRGPVYGPPFPSYPQSFPQALPFPYQF